MEAPVVHSDPDEMVAQLVVTVANIDTGAVASAEIVPGTLIPEKLHDGRHALNFLPIVQDLAKQINAEKPCWPMGKFQILLPESWQPELLADERHKLEIAAFVDQPLGRWRIHVLPNTPSSESSKVDSQLTELCLLASNTLLDLVIEHRTRSWLNGKWIAYDTWDVRLVMPGSTFFFSSAIRPTLYEALKVSSIDLLFRQMLLRSSVAPAYWIAESEISRDPQVVTISSTEIVDNMLLRNASADSVGSVAVWRNGEWHYSEVLAESFEDTYQLLSGEVLHRKKPAFSLRTPLPSPQWTGEEIPCQNCQKCREGKIWQDCQCVSSGKGDQPCSRCHDLRVTTHRCSECMGTGQRPLGATVTVFNKTRSSHQNWRPTDKPVINLSGGINEPLIAQLPEYYRASFLGDQLNPSGADLIDMKSGHLAKNPLLNGRIPLASNSDQTALEQYLLAVTAGRQGARIFLQSISDTDDNVAVLLRLGLGLDLACDLTLRRSLALDEIWPLVQKHYWNFDIRLKQNPITKLGSAFNDSLALASRKFLLRAENAINSAVRKYLSTELLPLPQQQQPFDPTKKNSPESISADINQFLPLIARRYCSTDMPTLMVRVTQEESQLYVGNSADATLISSAPTFHAIIHGLGFG